MWKLVSFFFFPCDWIITIENGQFTKYEKLLRLVFKKEGVNGSQIEYIDKGELRGWGVELFIDRVNIYKNMQNLINKNQKQQFVNNEGHLNDNNTPYV